MTRYDVIFRKVKDVQPGDLIQDDGDWCKVYSIWNSPDGTERLWLAQTMEREMRHVIRSPEQELQIQRPIRESTP